MIYNVLEKRNYNFNILNPAKNYENLKIKTELEIHYTSFNEM